MPHRLHYAFAGCLLFIFSVPPTALAQDTGDAWAKKKSAWVLLSPAERTQAQDFSEDYKSYLNVARSASASTREVIKRAQADGFVTRRADVLRRADVTRRAGAPPGTASP